MIGLLFLYVTNFGKSFLFPIIMSLAVSFISLEKVIGIIQFHVLNNVVHFVLYLFLSEKFLKNRVLNFLCSQQFKL